MGAIYDFEKRNKNNFVKPANLPDLGAVTIDAITLENWCESPIVYFSRAGEDNSYRTFANYQLSKIYDILRKENNGATYIEIGDTGHFEFRTSKKGKEYLYFVVYD